MRIRSEAAHPSLPSGAVERWSGGAVERWSGGVVERWSGGAVEWWSCKFMRRIFEACFRPGGAIDFSPWVLTSGNLTQIPIVVKRAGV